MKLEVGKVYSGEELGKLCDEEEGSERYHAVVGKKAVALVEDVGNDNWRVLCFWNPIDIFKQLTRY